MLKPRRASLWDGPGRIGPGSLVVVHADDRRSGGAPGIGRRFRRFVVESFPAPLGFRYDGKPNDGARRGLGHCVDLRALDNGARVTVSAFWCEEVAP